MTNDDKKFNTHIKEPRWQQIVSIIVVVGIVGLWIWFALH
jgi:hypothetical protein